MRKPVAALEISAGQRELLESVARSQLGAHREVVRAKALLMASQGVANSAIAQALSVSPASVANWRARFAEDGMARLGQVRKGRGRKPSIPQETIEEILDLTQNYRPQGQTHWSCRTMAETVGVSKDTVPATQRPGTTTQSRLIAPTSISGIWHRRSKLPSCPMPAGMTCGIASR
jgi:transposase